MAHDGQRLEPPAVRGSVRVILMLFAVLLSYWAVLFLVQRRLLFPAPPVTGGVPPADARQIWLPGLEGDTEAWFLPATRSAGPTPLIVFGHGNGEVIDYWPDEFTEPREWGFAVLLVEYPGYGRSPGRPSEASIRRAFLAAYDWASAQPEIDTARIVGYGRSLGGGAVALLSRERALAALILESTFTSTRPFARGFGAPSFLVRDPFDNEEAVRTFDRPLLIIHGERDEVIPTVHGRTLADVADVPIHLLPCGHNDCPRPWDVVSGFLRDAGVY